MTHGEMIDRFERGAAQLREACHGLSQADCLARPIAGKWSILELVVHLQDMDAIAIDRMKRVLTEDNPPLLNADENAYVAELYPHEQSLDDALTLFELNRRQMARALRKLQPEAFDRTGTHNLRGPLSVRQLVVGYSDHLEHHLRFLQEKRRALGKA